MVYEKNLSSNEFEGREKKLRETFKEKEKKMIEERSTLLKRIDVLEKDAEKFKEDIGEAKSKHNDSVQQILDLKLVIESIGSDKERFRAECNDLKFELTKLKN
jgi:chromosome segregation ATPase